MHKTSLISFSQKLFIPQMLFFMTIAEQFDYSIGAAYIMLDKNGLYNLKIYNILLWLNPYFIPSSGDIGCCLKSI